MITIHVNNSDDNPNAWRWGIWRSGNVGGVAEMTILSGSDGTPLDFPDPQEAASAALRSLDKVNRA